MKKVIVFAIIAMVALTLSAKPTYQGALNFDFPSTQTLDNGSSNDFDTNMGISPSIEALMDISQLQNLKLGLGLEFQLHRGIDLGSGGDPAYGFIPIYLTAKYAFLKDLPVQPEAILNVGYNFFSTNDDYTSADLGGGMCWGIGVGAWHPNGFGATLMYKANYGSIDNHGTTDVTQGGMTLGLGYRF